MIIRILGTIVIIIIIIKIATTIILITITTVETRAVVSHLGQRRGQNDRTRDIPMIIMIVVMLSRIAVTEIRIEQSN